MSSSSSSSSGEDRCLVCLMDLTSYSMDGVCDGCHEDYAISQCSYCHEATALDGVPHLPTGTLYPVPPDREWDEENYFLCSQCAQDYLTEFPHWVSFVGDAVQDKNETDGEDSICECELCDKELTEDDVCYITDEDIPYCYDCLPKCFQCGEKADEFHGGEYVCVECYDRFPKCLQCGEKSYDGVCEECE